MRQNVYYQSEFILLMEPNPYLVGSSLLFLIPTTMAAIYRQWPMYFALLYISFISSLYHATKYKYLLPFDYIGCYVLLYTLYQETSKLGYLLHFKIGSGSCAILFWGGYLTNHLTWSDNKIEASLSHLVMHFIVIASSICTSHLMSIEDKKVNES